MSPGLAFLAGLTLGWLVGAIAATWLVAAARGHAGELFEREEDLGW